VSLSPADKYHRFTRRLSKGQKFYERGLSWYPSGPLGPGEALDAGHADTPAPHQLTAIRRSLSCSLFLTPLLAAATAARGRGALRAGPHMVGQPRGHRGRLGLPALGRAAAVGGLGPRQEQAYTAMEGSGQITGCGF
jgi:hypothetical protein